MLCLSRHTLLKPGRLLIKQSNFEKPSLSFNKLDISQGYTTAPSVMRGSHETCV